MSDSKLVDALNNYVDDLNETNSELHAENWRLKHRVKTLKCELDMWKRKCQLLEKNDDKS